MPDGRLPGKARSGNDSFASLITAARRGDPQAIETLMSECRNYLLLIANEDIDPGIQAKFGASDFVQQTMLAACQNLGQFRGETPEEFRGWLRMILHRDLGRVRRQFFDAAGRDVARERRLDDSQANVPLISDSANTPGTDVVLREQARYLAEAMDRLPENYRKVIHLRDWEELSFPDIGRQMNISEEAARKLWKRAIARLEEFLDPVLGNSMSSIAKKQESPDDAERRQSP